MSREEIKNKVIRIIDDTVNVNLDSFSNQQLERSLFDLEIGLLPRDLLEIFFELQNVFNINFEESDIINSRFDVLENIVECIYVKEMSKQLA
ncbi:hypothetical protein C804_05745 [Lachnospiraceae bacterium A4]|jgi:hypothetical protein|nr:hypothetical protein C804_05745 [Lachnospiraceae bacterium A4]